MEAKSESSTANNDDQVSLAQAYWLWGVAANVAIAILVYGFWRNQAPVGALSLWAAYVAWNLMLIWTSADHYHGPPIWKGLAKAVTLIGSALVILTAVSLFMIVARRAENLEPGKSILSQLFG